MLCMIIKCGQNELVTYLEKFLRNRDVVGHCVSIVGWQRIWDTNFSDDGESFGSPLEPKSTDRDCLCLAIGSSLKLMYFIILHNNSVGLHYQFIYIT